MICKPVYISPCFILLMLPNYGCIEEFNAEFTDFESVLVIEATITDEIEPQEIVLSRTYEFQQEEIVRESDARVTVLSSDGTEFLFQEQEKGKYVSNISFAALPDLTYQLSVETQDGKSYNSATMNLPKTAELESVYAKRFTNDFGENGMGIFVDTSISGSTSGFYRYEYEETYKIIAPFWDPVELEVVESTPPNIIKVPRSLDERICYTTFDSNRIILADTKDLDGNVAQNVLIRFIPSDDYIISHRYSILVRQYSMSARAHEFFETLNEFSTNESLFSETQPGFLEGNVFSVNSSNEKVLGYFDVVNVDEKRIFFNYSDFYPNEDLPPYVDPCQLNTPTIGLIDLVRWDWVKYVDDNYIDSGLGSGPYITVPQVCGDCTALGTSEVPDFWIE